MKAKRLFGILLVLAMAVSLLPTQTVFAVSDTYGDYICIETDGKLEIVSCNLTTPNIVIPSAINGKAVTAIGNSAFSGSEWLTSIKIPDSVQKISETAFYNCNKLTSVTIGNGVTIIDDYAFYGCKSLTSIKIPDSVTEIGDSAFSDCERLTSLTIGKKVACINSSAFSGCRGLTSVVIPDSVTEIRDYAFSDCKSLTSITIGSGVKEIGDNILMWCDRLTDVNYYGTEAQWNNIAIYEPSGTENEVLRRAKMHYLTPKTPAQVRDITVVLDGSPIEFDVKPQIINGRTMVPMRKIFETLGAEVQWYNDTQTVVATVNEKVITMQIKKPTFTIKNTATGETKTVTLDSPPVIVSGRTLVPVRAVSESLNYNVGWNNDTRTVTIGK